MGVKKVPQWVWRHKKLTLALTVLALAVALNAVAYLHARAMTRFTAGGDRTSNPETLSVWAKVKVLVCGVNIPRPANRFAPDRLGLAFEVHRFPGPGGQSLEGWYVPRPGANALVVLCHGYSACKANLLPEAEAFHELGYETFLVDFRGVGGSDGDETTIGVTEADDVVSTWEFVRARWPGLPVVLFGQSMGSAAVLRAVGVRGIEPDALVLECPFDSLLTTVGNRCASMGVPRFPLAHLLVFWGGVQHGFNGFDPNPVEYAGGVRCPVLMLHGGRDVRVTLPQARAICDRLAGEKQMEVFEDLGHVSYVARQPEAWKRRVGAFLAGRGGPPPRPR